jgi:UDP-3-O-[3-hydroxymyristoyl] glucosamine N-acyltransferase
MSKTLAQLTDYLSGELIGDADYVIGGVGTLQKANSDQLAFLANSKYSKFLKETQAGCVILREEDKPYLQSQAIVVSDPYVAYAKAAALLFPRPKQQAGIHPLAIIAVTATVDNSAFIGPNVVIGENSVIGADVALSAGTVVGDECVIGNDTIIEANVTLADNTTVGTRVLIHSGVVVGADGFGIALDNGKWIKVPQLGGVRIGNDVEIGANTTIDRGAIEDTVIGHGVKLDNQIQIGHNVVIGDHTVIAGCVGIAGSTTIGRYCAIGGGTGIGGHLQIADGVQLTGMTMVTKSITEKGTYSSGIPAEPTREWHKNVVRYRQSEKLQSRISALEKKYKEID